jgi:hypothetical protein
MVSKPGRIPAANPRAIPLRPAPGAPAGRSGCAALADRPADPAGGLMPIARTARQMSATISFAKVHLHVPMHLRMTETH